MPEIWLRYGTTDVALDIRFENLANQISSSFPTMNEDAIKAALDSVPVSENMLVLVLAQSRAAAKTVDSIARTARAKGLAGITVDVLPVFAGSLRSNLSMLNSDQSAAPVSINRVDYHSLEDRMRKFGSTVVISQTTYDPLFGFAGAPTTILRHLYADKMTEVFKARTGVPAPGIENEMFKVAASFAESIPATAVELVANSSGIAGMHVGTPAEAFARSVSQLKSISVVETDPVKSAIVSASSESGPHSTLAGSLNSLWNSIHAVREGGSIALLAECRDGLGGGALQMFAEGRLKAEQLPQTPYMYGLEHIVYLQELCKKYELGLVSSLPHYYAKRLGFVTYSSVKDALDKLLAKHGKGHKALVLSDADITLLKLRG